MEVHDLYVHTIIELLCTYCLAAIYEDQAKECILQLQGEFMWVIG